MQHGLTIALAQTEAEAEPAANLLKLESWARKAAERGADFLVCPEMFMGLPSAQRPPAVIAHQDRGSFVRGLGVIARQTALYITAGCWEASADPRRVFNSAVTVTPDGTCCASYRKVHLFDALSVRESDTMAAGDRLPPLVKINGFQVGFAICYDLRFPELFRRLAEAGAELVVVPSAWYQGPLKEAHWSTLLRARAIENTFYVAGCALVGPSFCGCSAVFDPFGVPLAGAGEAQALLVCAIEKSRLTEVRAKLPSLANRRRDLLAD